MGPSKTEKRIQSSQEKLANEQIAQSRENAGVMRTLTGKAMPMADELGGFFRAIMSGDRGELMRLYGPQLEDIAAEGSRTRDQILETSPFGGQTDQMLIQTQLAEDLQRANILRGAPLVGAEGLGGLFQNLTGAAQGFGGLSTSSAGLGGNIFGNIMNQEAQRRAALTNMLGGLLGGGMEMAGMWTFNSLFNKPKGSGSSEGN